MPAWSGLARIVVTVRFELDCSVHAEKAQPDEVRVPFWYWMKPVLGSEKVESLTVVALKSEEEMAELGLPTLLTVMVTVSNRKDDPVISNELLLNETDWGVELMEAVVEEERVSAVGKVRVMFYRLVELSKVICQS